jgi:hypothetical protein
MTISKWTVPFLVLTCAIASQAATQEKKLKRSELPAAVLKTVEQESQGATISGYSSEMDDGRLVYEVAMRVRGHGRDVLIGADGSVLEIEEEVARILACHREGWTPAAGRCRYDHQGRVADEARHPRGVRGTRPYRRQAVRNPGRS